MGGGVCGCVCVCGYVCVCVGVGVGGWVGGWVYVGGLVCVYGQIPRDGLTSRIYFFQILRGF